MDQAANMARIEALGAGLRLQAMGLKVGPLRAHIARLVNDGAMRATAQRLSARLAADSPGAVLAEAIKELTGQGQRPSPRRATG